MASLLQEAVKIIEEMHISEQNIDVQGDLYEYLLMQLTTTGKNGQLRQMSDCGMWTWLPFVHQRRKFVRGLDHTFNYHKVNQ